MDFIALILFSLPITWCVPWDGPMPTPLPTVCSTPTNPTPAAFHELLRRSDATTTLCGQAGTSVLACPSETCALILNHKVLGCCDDDRDHCTYFTDCLGYYESSALCGVSVSNGVSVSVSVSCVSMESTLTCVDSSLPYCRRWTHTSGYSRYECATSPAVLSLETPAFTASVGTPSSSLSASTSATSCPEQVSIGGIVGGVIGGMAVLMAGVIGGIALLRRGRKSEDTHSVGSQGQLLTQQSPAKGGEYSSAAQGVPSAPPYGIFPQGQQPAIELS
ncbi:hypothetical protein BDD12DRAFT_891017 [Trichophaea hybrida]|nr:hypothetical protein BDD12DRAFT_891017 [Trichophaea hybrida]